MIARVYFFPPFFYPQKAATHELITNCINCGKIICALEGGGACAFCGFDTGKKRKPLSEKVEAGLEHATKQKDQLVLFDRTSAQRTKVYGT